MLVILIVLIRTTFLFIVIFDISIDSRQDNPGQTGPDAHRPVQSRTGPDWPRTGRLAQTPILAQTSPDKFRLARTSLD